MSEEIRVNVINKGRKNLYMRYICPENNKAVERSTGTKDRKQATKLAAQWEAELNEGRYVKPSRMSWEQFLDYYRRHFLPSVAKRSAGTYESTLNVFTERCNPQKLSDVTTTRVTGFVTELRKLGRTEATVARHLRHLKAMCRWANREGLLPILPKFNMLKRIKGSKAMRGRPITGEEFDRMLKVVPKVVENAAAASWKFYLKGLWESGLRLSESLTLRWDDEPAAIVVDFSGKRPMLRIPAEAHKANRDTLLPITPEFAAHLDTVPERERRGRVFKLLAVDGSLMKLDLTTISKLISKIGETAGIVVDERIKGETTIRKFASAHDLRRAFGARWSRRVMPTVLRELMRHSHISTTMQFYVGDDAEATAETLWNSVGDTLGDTSREDEERESTRNAK